MSLMAATRLIKVGTGPCFPLCSIPSSSNNICKHLGTEETSCWTFGRGMLSHSCPIEDSSCSAVLDVFRWWNIWTAGRSVQQLDSSATKPRCWNRSRMWFNFVLLKYARPSLKKGADVALEPVHTLQHWWSLSRCAGFHFHRHWELITSWMVRLLFSLEDAASGSDPSDHRTVSLFASVHFNELWSREDGRVSGPCSLLLCLMEL